MHYARVILLTSMLAASALAGKADACGDLTPQDRTRLAQYVAKQYRIPERAHIQLREQTVVNDLCYRRLVFQGEGPLGKMELRLYASPDLRFLSTDMLDSRVDPGEQEMQEARQLMGRLLEGEYAARGPENAPLTLVVFSDFQCPFCRRMQQILATEPLLIEDRSVRLVFRHMPLAQHDWAEEAARAAACAQFQSQAAFWHLHDALFVNQNRISRQNVTDQVFELAAKTPSLEIGQFRTCVERQMSFGAVVRDRELGARAGVTGTPTLFLNGEQLPGISDPAQFHEILADALRREKAREPAPQRGGIAGALR
ncbi:MAG: DsbA family protein [Acidobacteriaceae bacterium]|nr:DsbA family protein [Acidobacteriaceae bacterium]